jgi:hypothetical protein
MGAASAPLAMPLPLFRMRFRPTFRFRRSSRSCLRARIKSFKSYVSRGRRLKIFGRIFSGLEWFRLEFETKVLLELEEDYQNIIRNLAASRQIFFGTFLYIHENHKNIFKELLNPGFSM